MSSNQTAPRGSWETSPTPRAKEWLLTALAMVLGGILLGIIVRQYDDVQVVFSEDGPIETLQAGLLAINAAIFALVFLKSSGARAVFCVVVVFAVIFAATRELPRCDSAYTGSGMCLTRGWKRSIVLFAAGGGLTALLWRRREWSAEVVQLTGLRWVWPCFVVAAILVGAEIAEHHVHIEIEESLELAAYLYLLAFGLWILRYTKPIKQRLASLAERPQAL